MVRSIRAVDMFCGAGGTSTGLIKACEAFDIEVELFAINHWQLAVESHAANHPHVNHLCADVDQVNPGKVVSGGRIDLLVASPECTHHSIARGGKPKHEQGRASAWSVLRWIEELQPSNILIENVREFMWWSPLRKNGKRDRRYKRGCTYEAWINALRNLGYQADVKILTCADYGDPTTRARWFLRGSRGWKHPAWPAQTHAKAQDELQPWRNAREIIDWTRHGRSIFERKKPLAENTLKRIEAGIRKFWGKMAEPFLIVLKGGGWKNKGRDINTPLPTITANGNHIGLVEPFLLPHRTFKNMNVDSIGQPLRTVTGHSADFNLVEPFITIMKGQSNVRGIDEPVPSITSNPHLYLCEPFILPVNHGKDDKRTHSVHTPVPTITGAHTLGLLSPFMVKYYGTGGARPVDAPLDAVTAKDRFGLVEGDMMKLDILFRMLEPSELAAAQGFPEEYEFKGTRRDQVKQIGNAVPVNTAAALCGSALSA